MVSCDNNWVLNFFSIKYSKDCKHIWLNKAAISKIISKIWVVVIDSIINFQIFRWFYK